VNSSGGEWQVYLWACVMPSEVRSCYEIFVFSSSRLGEAIVVFMLKRSLIRIKVMMQEPVLQPRSVSADAVVKRAGRCQPAQE
jgi:hypothetical protein